MVSRKLIAASYRPLVLSLIERKSTYGYDLIQQIGDLSGDSIRWSPGKLYPLLHELEAEGLLSADWQTENAGRDRKVYAITDKGRKALAASRRDWLEVHSVLVKLWGTGSAPDLSLG